jgi:hypothetical protein
VTELVMRAVPKPKEVYAGFLFFGVHQFAEVSKRFAEFAESNKNPKVTAMVSILPTPPEFQLGVVAMPVVFGSPEYAKEQLKWLWDLGPLADMTAPMTYEQGICCGGVFGLFLTPVPAYRKLVSSSKASQTNLSRDLPRRRPTNRTTSSSDVSRQKSSKQASSGKPSSRRSRDASMAPHSCSNHFAT